MASYFYTQLHIWNECSDRMGMIRKYRNVQYGVEMFGEYDLTSVSSKNVGKGRKNPFWEFGEQNFNAGKVN